jgi:hypothetical protein
MIVEAEKVHILHVGHSRRMTVVQSESKVLKIRVANGVKFILVGQKE